MKFSVLLPTYNRLDILKYAVQSVLMQDYDDWELIVSDNQSEDDVKGYIESLADDRIYYSRTERLLNVTANWNRALDRATGDYFIMLGDDDALMLGYFSTLERLIRQYEEPDWIYTEALEYAYPGVLPDHPDGYLLGGRNPWLQQQTTGPFDSALRLSILQNSFHLSLHINFNMQHSVVKRTFASQLSAPFYQSLFPDYYATLVGLLRANSFIFFPQPMAVIGITKKSHGYYYFNNRLSEATNILHSDQTNQVEMALLDDWALANMNWIQVGWLSALKRLTLNYQTDLTQAHLAVPIASIRKRCIKKGIDDYLNGQLAGPIYQSLHNGLPRHEFWRAFVPLYLYLQLLHFLGPLRANLSHLISSLRPLKTNKAIIFLSVDGLSNIMDVVRQQSPAITINPIPDQRLDSD
jgi:hypothetical protein